MLLSVNDAKSDALSGLGTLFAVFFVVTVIVAGFFFFQVFKAIDKSSKKDKENSN